MTNIKVDVWLYGELARYAGLEDQGAYGNVLLTLSAGDTIEDLLAALQMPTAVRGITFVNGNLSAMPGLQPDLNHPLQDGDRVAFFHMNSMWPFQYRFGVPMAEELSQAMHSDQGLHHAYTQDDE